MTYQGKEINAVRLTGNYVLINQIPTSNLWTIVHSKEDKEKIMKELKIENDGDKRRE